MVAFLIAFTALGTTAFSTPYIINNPFVDATIECDEAANGLPYEAPIFVDDEDPNLLIIADSMTVPTNCGYMFVRSWTAIDDDGNSLMFMQTVTVTDTTPPSITITHPMMAGVQHGDILYLECQEVMALTVDDAIAEDNCCLADFTFQESVQAGNCPNDGYIQKMTCGYVATDCCGNVDSLFFEVYVIDETDPKLHGIPGDVIIGCNEPLPPPPNVFADDNCVTSNDLNVVFSQTVNGLIVTRTWTVTDWCGNFDSDTQTIYISNEDDIQFENFPPDYTISCSLPDPFFVTVTATSECGTVVVTSEEEEDTSDPCVRIISRIYTATHENGSMLVDTQFIYVVDDVAPVITLVHPDLAGTASGDTLEYECQALPIFDADDISATDLCSAVESIVFMDQDAGQVDCLQEGYYLLRYYRWDVTDICGNTSFFHFYIKIKDNTPPVITGGIPADITVPCNNIPAPSANITATDNCDAILDVTSSDQIIGSGCTYTIERTWAVTDDCGNATEHVQILTVVDTEPPVFTDVPSDITVECTAIPDPYDPSAMDNCQSVTITMSDSTGLGCPYNLFRTWIASDDCGNEATYTQVIRVIDTAPPVGVEPADLTISCEGIIPIPVTPSFTDACDGSPIVGFSENTTAITCGEQLTRTWTGTDDCGNASSVDQVITILDGNAPVISLTHPLLAGFSDGDTLTIECDNPVSFDEMDASATDACTSANVTYGEANPTIGDCDIDGFLSITASTWTATDDCGNAAFITIYVRVEDNTPPVGVEPADLSLSCEDPMPTPVTPVFTDVCDNNPTIVFGENITNIICGEQITWTWTATDHCGNASSVDQIITILDSGAPSLSLTHPMLIALPDGDTLIIECDNPISFDETDATSLDACGGSTIAYIPANPTLGDCDMDGFLTITALTWTAMDDCGNSTSITIYLRVEDNVPPVGVEPSDITLNCGDPIPDPVTPLFTDICDANPNVVFSENTQAIVCGEEITWTWTATDHCGNASSVDQVIRRAGVGTPSVSLTNPALIGLNDGDTLTMECDNILSFDASDATPSDPCSNVTLAYSEGTPDVGDCDVDGYLTITPVTWTATNDCGTMASVTIYLRVEDNVPPVGVEPSDITISCTDNMPPAVTPSFTDVCDANPNIVFSENTVPIVCGEEITWTWTATDHCGNSSSVDQVIRVFDGNMPSISLINQLLVGFSDGDTLTVECDNIPMFDESDVSVLDPCSSVNVIYGTGTPTIGDCDMDGYITITALTWTATDDCGNASSITIYLRIEDNTPPVFTTMPADITVPCGDPIPPCTQPDVMDACSNVSLSSSTSDVAAVGGFIRNCNWTATDDCGNQSTFTQAIFVEDEPMLDSVVVTASNCGADNGAGAVYTLLDESNYSWDWSPDFGTPINGVGNSRVDLPPSHYWVTAFTGSCMQGFKVMVADTCLCEMAVLESLNTTDAGCGSANGTADIQLVGDESNYTYLWVPDLGTGNLAGNSRTDLPAAHYVVLVYFMGDLDCVEKYEFDINDDCFDCPPVFEVDAMIINTDQNVGQVCVPAMHGISVSQDIAINQQFYTGEIEECDTQQVRGYEYKTFANIAQPGQYSVEWERGNDFYYTLVENMDELAAAMYQMDADGQWKNDPKGRCLVTTGTAPGYGQIWITDVATSETYPLALQDLEVVMGSGLTLTEGDNEIIYTSSLSGCDDTLSVLLNINTPDTEIVIGTSDANDIAPQREGGNKTALQDDFIKTSINGLITVDLLANDHIDGEVTCMELIEKPTNGQAFIHDKTLLSYLPKTDFCQPIGQADGLVYEICTADGRKFSATAKIEVACRSEHVLYPNPADRHVYLDLSSLGTVTALEVLLVNQLGVEVDRIAMDQAPAGPFKIDLESYRSGYYTVWICPKNSKPLLKKLVITRL